VSCFGTGLSISLASLALIVAIHVLAKRFD
jgi:hypothetical protein